MPASDATPQASHPEQNPEENPEQNDEGNEIPETTTTTTPENPQLEYPAPQPAAMPALPAETGVPLPSTYYFQPTPTQGFEDAGPPAPQPGAVPVPPPERRPSRPHKTRKIRRYPEVIITPIPPQTPYPQQMPYPPQMSYQAPTSQFPPGSSTTTEPHYPYPTGMGGAPGPTSIREGDMGDNNYLHPPGYYQNVHASGFNGAQRAVHNPYRPQNYDYDDDESIWSVAKKWVSVAGSTLAAAEEEVWKRINRDW
ncbi:hypothetical protein ACO1O0_001400 [Amphichorda felina]